MGRSQRVDIGGYVYHIINRANARLPIFFEEEDYLSFINTPMTNADLEEIRESVHKGKPYGEESWVDKKIEEFKLQATVRGRGRPKKGT